MTTLGGDEKNVWSRVLWYSELTVIIKGARVTVNLVEPFTLNHIYRSTIDLP